VTHPHAHLPPIIGSVSSNSALAPTSWGLTLATTLPVRGSTSINISELYTDEERRLLLFLHVLRARATGDQDTVMRLVEVSCSYRDTSIERTKNVPTEDVVVRRPSSIARQWSALQRWTVSACV
jgi:hypothetical protein